MSSGNPALASALARRLVDTFANALHAQAQAADASTETRLLATSNVYQAQYLLLEYIATLEGIASRATTPPSPTR